jgi:Uma2 family endonuclease
MALTLPIAMKVTPEQFWHICEANPEAVMELNAQGQIEQMTPTGWQSSCRNASLTEQLRRWWRQTRSGAVFDSSGGFCLPNGAVRSPDAAWVSEAALQAVSSQNGDRFFPGCPEFVVELASASDSRLRLQQKLTEYIANGTQLGWLILPTLQQVEIYQPNQPTQVLDHPPALSGEPLLAGFVLDLRDILA